MVRISICQASSLGGVAFLAGSIVAVEARHTAIVRALINPNGNPVPRGFELVTKPQDVLAAVGPLLGPES